MHDERQKSGAWAEIKLLQSRDLRGSQIHLRGRSSQDETKISPFTALTAWRESEAYDRRSGLAHALDELLLAGADCDVVAFETPIQRGAADPKHFAGDDFVAARLFEDSKDGDSLEIG